MFKGYRFLFRTKSCGFHVFRREFPRLHEQLRRDRSNTRCNRLIAPRKLLHRSVRETMNYTLKGQTGNDARPCCPLRSLEKTTDEINRLFYPRPDDNDNGASPKRQPPINRQTPAGGACSAVIAATASCYIRNAFGRHRSISPSQKSIRV